MKSSELPPPPQLMKFIVGRWISKPIYVATELGIADMLAEGPKKVIMSCSIFSGLHHHSEKLSA